MEAESIAAYSGLMDWDTPFKNAPSRQVGEFSAPGTNAVVADLHQTGSTETRRTGDGQAAK